MSNCVSTQRPAIESLLTTVGISLTSNLALPIRKTTKFFLSINSSPEDLQEIFFSGISKGHDRRSNLQDIKVAGFSFHNSHVEPSEKKFISESCCAMLIRLPENGDKGLVQGNIEQATVELLELVSESDDVVIFKRTNHSQCYTKVI